MNTDKQTNIRRHQLVEDCIFEMEEHWHIPRETTGTVLTAFFGKFRQTLRDGSFDTLAQELFEIVKDNPSSYEKYQRNMKDERGTSFDESKVVRKKGRFCKAIPPLELGEENKA